MSEREPQRIYVVMGTTGEYSDRTEWAVRAFLSEDRAKEEVSALEDQVLPLNEMRANGTYYDNEPYDWDERKAWLESAVPLDPKVAVSYTGTHYYYLDVEIGA